MAVIVPWIVYISQWISAHVIKTHVFFYVFEYELLQAEPTICGKFVNGYAIEVFILLLFFFSSSFAVFSIFRLFSDEKRKGFEFYNFNPLSLCVYGFFLYDFIGRHFSTFFDYFFFLFLLLFGVGRTVISGFCMCFWKSNKYKTEITY